MYHKIAATYLFNGYKMLGSDDVLILKKQGSNYLVEDIITKVDAGEDIEYIDGLVCPGFINAHCHLELSHLKNTIPMHTGMVDFLLGVMQHRDGYSKEQIADGIEQAETEMLQNGIVAVGDICNTDDTVAQKKLQKLHYTNFIETSGFVPSGADKRFAAAKTIQHVFLQNNLNANIVPHAPYSVSDALLQLIHQESTAVSSIHVNESSAEKIFMSTASGDFLKLYNALGITIDFFVPDTTRNYIHPQVSNQLLVHNVVTTPDDITHYLKHSTTPTQLHFVLCPNANLYIGNGLPNVDLLKKAGLNICLGTDSLASNTQLDIWEEISTLKKHFPGLPLETLLQWATINGAKALGISDVFGSFEKGKQGAYVVKKVAAIMK